MPKPRKPVVAAPSLALQPTLLVTGAHGDYALEKAAACYKQERFGPYRLRRPESLALWAATSSEPATAKPDATFSLQRGDAEQAIGEWTRHHAKLPDAWPVSFGPYELWCRLTNNQHVGIFPEQTPHWLWWQQQLQARRGQPLKVLNLFGYTGAASIAAAQAGAQVTHVDASKKAIGWAKENATLNNLAPDAIRWIVDDAQKFVARECRRGQLYDLILLDPPKYGRGPTGEVWDLFQHLPQLLNDCVALLSKQALGFWLTAYALRASPLTLGQLLLQTCGERGGQIFSGELANRDQAGRVVAAAMYAGWVAPGLMAPPSGCWPTAHGGTDA